MPAGNSLLRYLQQQIGLPSPRVAADYADVRKWVVSDWSGFEKRSARQLGEVLGGKLTLDLPWEDYLIRG